MRKYDTVIFDMDGTILDTLEDLQDAVNYALEKLEMPKRSLEEIRQFVGNGVRRLMELSVPGGFDNARFEEAFAIFKDYYGEHCNDKTKVYDGIMELMRDLTKDGYALAIVSNKLDSAVKDLNEKYFKDYVKVAIGDREGMKRKPAPDTVFAALRELGRKAETAVYIGDSEVDLATAKNAGLPCISVLWGFRDKAFLEGQGGVMFAQTPEKIKQFLK